MGIAGVRYTHKGVTVSEELDEIKRYVGAKLDPKIIEAIDRIASIYTVPRTDALRLLLVKGIRMENKALGLDSQE